MMSVIIYLIHRLIKSGLHVLSDIRPIVFKMLDQITVLIYNTETLVTFLDSLPFNHVMPYHSAGRLNISGFLDAPIKQSEYFYVSVAVCLTQTEAAFSSS